jgi:hypothetical protein
MASSTIISSPLAKHHYGRGIADGEAKGEAKAIVVVLRSRGIPVTEEQRARITDCTDLQQLSTWLDRVGTVTSANELFD